MCLYPQAFFHDYIVLKFFNFPKCPTSDGEMGTEYVINAEKGMIKKQVQSTHRAVKHLDKLTRKLLGDKTLRPAFGMTLLQLQRDTKAALSFWGALDKNSQQKNRQKVIDSNKLQIGCGKRYMQGFINLDIFPPADIIWDCRYGLPFSANKFDFIFTEHFFEHVDFPISSKKILREIYRVLKPKGEIVIGVPDGGKVIRAYCQGDKNFLNSLYRNAYSRRQPPVELYGNIDLVNYLFRDQLENPNYTTHYWAYDEISLKKLFRSMGFRKVEMYPFNPRFCNSKRKFFTLYLKATK